MEAAIEVKIKDIIKIIESDKSTCIANISNNKNGNDHNRFLIEIRNFSKFSMMI